MMLRSIRPWGQEIQAEKLLKRQYSGAASDVQRSKRNAWFLWTSSSGWIYTLYGLIYCDALWWHANAEILFMDAESSQRMHGLLCASENHNWPVNVSRENTPNDVQRGKRCDGACDYVSFLHPSRSTKLLVLKFQHAGTVRRFRKTHPSRNFKQAKNIMYSWWQRW